MRAKVVNTTLTFQCPGCGYAHSVDLPRWTFNGDLAMPTLSPSLLIKSGHYASHFNAEEDTCWCKYNEEHPDKKAPFACGICHSFVNEGRIQFLNDCTHSLAGQTVDLPELEEAHG
jgi:hypothetical protein